MFTATVEDQGDAPYPRVDVYYESLSTEIWDYTPGQDPVGSFITSVATGKPAILGHGFYGVPESGQQVEATTITGVPTFNDPGEDGIFSAGETVEVTFTFSRPVRVDTTDGTPAVEVLLGGTTARQALYLRGSGTGQLVFGYTLTGVDGTHGSLLVEPNTLALNGGSIRDVANGLDAAIGHQGGGAVFVRQASANTPASGSPGISGTAQAGETLTADTSGIADEDGMTDAVLAYQWIRQNLETATEADIQGATGRTYAVTAEDEGKALMVTVTFTDDAGNEESLTSHAVIVSPPLVIPANTPSTGAPGIDGSPVVGHTLTATTSGIVDDDGIANAVFAYQWLADDTEISGATGSSYILVASVAGKAIKVRVTFTDDAGNDESLTSEATATVAARPNSAATGIPTITGTAQVGETLTAATSGIADGDGLTNATFAYQWLAGESDISGAAGSSYTLTASEKSKTIEVRVTFTDDAGNDEALTSAATATVAARPNSPATGAPTISGTAQVGEMLTADTSGIADEDGLDNATFTYQWLADDTEISGATGPDYTLAQADEGKAVKVKVSFSDDAGNEEALTSAATTAVAPRPPLTASFLGTPTTHDGQTDFTFELRFSETPRDGFSYKTLRDHSFTVTGGTVARARRLEPPGNVRWEITISPESNADVTVVLPITTDCGDRAAICTGDGRKLSNRLSLTVSGPSG